MKRFFHSLVALSVALPLGAGGFCCCLIGHGHRAAPAAVAAETHACCAENAPAPARPDPEKDHHCACPARELAVFAKAQAGPALLETVSAPGDFLPPAPAPIVFAGVEPSPVLPVEHPPPRVPLDLAPSLLRC